MRARPALSALLPYLILVITLFPHFKDKTAKVHRGSVICSTSYQLVNCRPGSQTKVSLTPEPSLLILSPVSLSPK